MSAVVLGALGYRAWDRGVLAAGKGSAYEPWSDWQGHAGEGIVRPLHAAILAANPHDTQPWLFEPHGDSVTVYADRSRNLGTFDPFRREMHLGIGCALANLQTATYALGYASNAEISAGRLVLSPPNRPIEVARVSLRPKNIPDDDVVTPGIPNPTELAAAIGHRHTNRGPYLPDKKMPGEFLRTWNGGSHGKARIHFVTRSDDLARMRDIIIGATEAIIADPQMSADSARWFRTGRREIEAHHDGVTTDTAGLSPLMQVAAKLLPDQNAKSADQYWLSATRDRQVATAPVFGMILVRDRLDMAAAIAAGQLWQYLHLSATTAGLAAQPMNQPVEMMDRNAMLGRKDMFGPALGNLANLPGWEPTFVFRMGYAEREALPSPRRPLADVIVRNT